MACPNGHFRTQLSQVTPPSELIEILQYPRPHSISEKFRAWLSYPLRLQKGSSTSLTPESRFSITYFGSNAIWGTLGIQHVPDQGCLYSSALAMRRFERLDYSSRTVTNTGHNIALPAATNFFAFLHSYDGVFLSLKPSTNYPC